MNNTISSQTLPQAGKPKPISRGSLSIHTLSSPTIVTSALGIELSTGGAYDTPFTITSTGVLTDNYNTVACYGALNALELATVTNAGHVYSNRYAYNAQAMAPLCPWLPPVATGCGWQLKAELTTQA